MPVGGGRSSVLAPLDRGGVGEVQMRPLPVPELTYGRLRPDPAGAAAADESPGGAHLRVARVVVQEARLDVRDGSDPEGREPPQERLGFRELGGVPVEDVATRADAGVPGTWWVDGWSKRRLLRQEREMARRLEAGELGWRAPKWKALIGIFSACAVSMNSLMRSCNMGTRHGSAAGIRRAAALCLGQDETKSSEQECAIEVPPRLGVRGVRERHGRLGEAEAPAGRQRRAAREEEEARRHVPALSHDGMLLCRRSSEMESFFLIPTDQPKP